MNPKKAIDDFIRPLALMALANQEGYNETRVGNVFRAVHRVFPVCPPDAPKAHGGNEQLPPGTVAVAGGGPQLKYRLPEHMAFMEEPEGVLRDTAEVVAHAAWIYAGQDKNSANRRLVQWSKAHDDRLNGILRALGVDPARLAEIGFSDIYTESLYDPFRLDPALFKAERFLSVKLALGSYARNDRPGSRTIAEAAAELEGNLKVEDGNVRSWLVRVPSQHTWFQVNWTPGMLHVGGDMGELTINHYQALADLAGGLRWLAEADFSYLMSKSPNYRKTEFDAVATVDSLTRPMMERPDEFLAWVVEIAKLVRDEAFNMSRHDAEELLDRFETFEQRYCRSWFADGGRHYELLDHFDEAAQEKAGELAAAAQSLLIASAKIGDLTADALYRRLSFCDGGDFIYRCPNEENLRRLYAAVVTWAGDVLENEFGVRVSGRISQAIEANAQAVPSTMQGSAIEAEAEAPAPAI